MQTRYWNIHLLYPCPSRAEECERERERSIHTNGLRKCKRNMPNNLAERLKFLCLFASVHHSSFSLPFNHFFGWLSASLNYFEQCDRKHLLGLYHFSGLICCYIKLTNVMQTQFETTIEERNAKLKAKLKRDEYVPVYGCWCRWMYANDSEKAWMDILYGMNDERTNEQKNEWINEWMGAWMSEQTNEQRQTKRFIKYVCHGCFLKKFRIFVYFIDAIVDVVVVLIVIEMCGNVAIVATAFIHFSHSRIHFLRLSHTLSESPVRIPPFLLHAQNVKQQRIV